MATKTNQWSPDTCGCVIEFTWDDSVPADSRAHTYSRTITACPVHTLLASLSSHWTTVLEENTRKNRTFGQALSAKATLVIDQMQWSWNADHSVLTVSFGANLTAQQKTTLQTWCNTNLGAGKVVVT